MIKTFKLLMLVCIALSSNIYSQVGINTIDPQTTLDVIGVGTSTTTPDGIIAPRITRQQLAAKSITTYAAAQTGAIVYVTDATLPTGTIPSVAQTIEIISSGYYFFNGIIWKNINSNAQNIYNTNGSLTGTRVVTQGANTLAFTASAVNAFSVDGTTLSVDATNDRVGVGTAAPTNRLHVSATTNPVKFEGLVADAAATNVVVVGSDGILKTITKTTLVPTYTASNGITNTASNDIRLGGLLTTPTTLTNTATNNLSVSGPGVTSFTSTTGTATSAVSPILIIDGGQGANKILTSDANGNGTWKNPITNLIQGTMVAVNSPISLIGGGTGTAISNGSITINGENNTFRYNLGSYIDLPTGKWLVEANILIDLNSPSIPGLNYLYNKFTFTESTVASGSSIARSPNLTGNTLIGGSMNTVPYSTGLGLSYFSVVNGKLVINNATTATKRYYLCYWEGVRKFTNFQTASSTSSTANANISLLNVGSNTYAENYITAQQIN